MHAPPNPVTGAHLKPIECLQCKAEVDLGDQWGGCGTMRD